MRETGEGGDHNKGEGGEKRGSREIRSEMRIEIYIYIQQNQNNREITDNVCN